MSRKPLFERAMTGVERQRRYAERHAVKLARKKAHQGRKPTLLTEADMLGRLVTADDFRRVIPEP